MWLDRELTEVKEGDVAALKGDRSPPHSPRAEVPQAGRGASLETHPAGSDSRLPTVRKQLSIC